MEQEIWKIIEDYPMYEVSNLGKVRKISSGQLLKQCLDSKGYPSVNVNDGKKATRKVVHRLVAVAFIPNPHNLTCVDHIDTNKTNNNVNNLRWCTYEGNMRNSKTIEHLRSTPKQHKRLRDSHKIVALKDNVCCKTYLSISNAKNDGHDPKSVWLACNGKRIQHHGYKWMYLSDYESLVNQ